MGIVLSIFLMAAGGALLASGGSSTVDGMNPDSAGLVLIGSGLLWFALSIMLWNAFRDREEPEPRVIPLRGARPAGPPRPAATRHH
jgi:hypothetical protein